MVDDEMRRAAGDVPEGKHVTVSGVIRLHVYTLVGLVQQCKHLPSTSVSKV